VIKKIPKRMFEGSSLSMLLAKKRKFGVKLPKSLQDELVSLGITADNGRSY
jgi:hypothetical protein